MKQKPNHAEINDECNACLKIVCPKLCFNHHVGSMIALNKLLGAIERESEIKIFVVGRP